MPPLRPATTRPAGLGGGVATYEQLRVPRALDAGLFRKVLQDLSCRRYEACAEAVPEAFGLSASTVSRRFIRASARHLEALQTRRLDDRDVVALVLDGKTARSGDMGNKTVQGHG